MEQWLSKEAEDKLSDKKVKSIFVMFVDEVDPPDHKCGGCQSRLAGNLCTIVEGPINLTTGTCNYWTKGEEAKKEMESPSKMQKQTAGYITAPLVNCSTCKHYEAGDKKGRGTCKLFQAGVDGPQCCMAWEATGAQKEVPWLTKEKEPVG